MAHFKLLVFKKTFVAIVCWVKHENSFIQITALIFVIGDLKLSL